MLTSNVPYRPSIQARNPPLNFHIRLRRTQVQIDSMPRLRRDVRLEVGRGHAGKRLLGSCDEVCTVDLLVTVSTAEDTAREAIVRTSRREKEESVLVLVSCNDQDGVGVSRWGS